MFEKELGRAINRRRGLGLMCAGLGALALSGCMRKRAVMRFWGDISGRSGNQRITGHSILEQVQEGPFPIGGTIDSGSLNADGQAVVLGNRRGNPIFGLLHGPDWKRSMAEMARGAVAYDTLESPLSRSYASLDFDKAYAEASARKISVLLSERDYPYFVTFDDLSDPQTVKTVFPTKGSAPEFVVEAVRFTAWVEEPLTTGIAALLPWLSDHAGSLSYDGGQLHADEPAKDLTVSAFSFGKSCRT